jgi:hypothetical protein
VLHLPRLRHQHRLLLKQPGNALQRARGSGLVVQTPDCQRGERLVSSGSVWNLTWTARTRCGGWNRKRRDPRCRGGSGRRRARHHAGEPCRRTPRGGVAWGRARMGRGRCPGTAVRTRRVRRRGDLGGRDVRAGSRGTGRRDGARVPPRGHDRPDHVRPRRAGRRALRALRTAAGARRAATHPVGATRNMCASSSAIGSPRSS